MPSRLEFLKRAVLPTVAGVAGVAAARLDPEGEPVPENASLIVVNAPNTTLSNLNIRSGVPRRAAIEFTDKAQGTHMINGHITVGPDDA